MSPTGALRWDGCRNILIRKYEKAASGSEIIASFNINTNKWVAKYVYVNIKHTISYLKHTITHYITLHLIKTYYILFIPSTSY